MRLNLERTSVVLVGAWNQAIFTPEWVARALFVEDVASVVGMLSTGGLATQFVAEGVQLQALPGRLELRFMGHPLDCVRVERLARDCLEKLPQTPVQAYGINAGFDVDEADVEHLAHLVTLDDEPRLAGFGVVGRRTLLRELERDDRTRLRLTMTRGHDGFRLDLNWHRQVDADAAAAAELFAVGTVSAALDEFRRVLREVYQLEANE